MDFLKDLNPEQREAAGKADGASLIVAGPGTGKTRTLVARIAFLIQKGIAPENILALTFTKSAAREMRDRLRELLGEERIAGLWVDTFHAAALKILKEENYPFIPGQQWTLALEEEKEALLVGRLKGARELKDFLNSVRQSKQALRPPETPEAEEYQQRLLALGRLDYDDLLFFVHKLFEENTQALGRWKARFHHILVDEFQDTSFAQYAVLKKLADGNICAIGDPDQAIYGFSLQDFSPFEFFKKDFPTHRIFPLTANYRCQSMIVEAATQVIGNNASSWRRELRAHLEKGLPLEILPFATEAQEAEMIVRKIEELIGGSSHFSQDSGWAREGAQGERCGFSDIVILYRFHAQAKRIEEALKGAGLPFRVWGKKETDEDLEGFQNAAAMEGEGITLMTLHRSKGLEFPVVFIAGCEDGILPQADTTPEERRLFYVGMTRAKRRLFLSWSRKRFLFGKTLPGTPSIFLNEIQEELRLIKESEPFTKKKPAENPTPTLFSL